MGPSTIHLHLRKVLQRYSPALSTVTEWIPYFPLNIRKLVMTVAQTGLDDSDDRILSAAESIVMDSYVGPDKEVLGRRLFYEILREVVRSPFNRSLVMMLLRCEAAATDDGSEEALRAGMLKEVQASQNVFSEDQLLDYSTLFGNSGGPWSPYAPITPAWSRNAKFLANALSKSMADLSNRVLYPRVQRKKNMSRESCYNLFADGYRHDTLEVENFRTVDLEIHRYRTGGNETKGDLEMRWSWKYNVLKPRVYYCTGASLYWKSRYMKEIAISMMNSWPMTHVARRKDPDSLTWYLGEDDYLTMWDYESFTTNLSELKFFTYWMARYLEDDLYVRQHPLHLFDLLEGVIERNIWDLLDEYNVAVNIYSRFSVHRVIDLIGFGPDLDSLAQHNSGALGVLGNIGMSTALHGIHIGPISRTKEDGVSVGDDAFAFQSMHPSKQLIPHIQHLGKIHPEKFEIFKPIRSEVEFQVWKFLKRRLTRDQDGIHLDVLYDFPILAYVFGVESENRTVPKFDKEDVIHKFCGQVGALYWNINRRGYDFSDEDIFLLREILTVCYRKLNLRFNGSLPGIRHSDGFQVRISVPPLNWFDPRLEDWAEYLWDHAIEKYILLPIEIETDIYAKDFMYVGERFMATSNSFLGLMEDIGVLEKTGPLKAYVDVSSENRWLYKKQVSGKLSDVYEYEYMCEPPEYYNSVVRSISGAVRLDYVWYSH